MVEDWAVEKVERRVDLGTQPAQVKTGRTYETTAKALGQTAQ